MPKSTPPGAPYRSLKLTSPYARGEDIKRLQAAIKTTVDGQYGPKTQRAVRRRLFEMGCASKNLDLGATITYQRVMRKIVSPPLGWNSRAADRREMAAKKGGEATAVMKWAKSKLGIAETGQYNSNRGPEIDIWQREVGMLAQPWCAAYCIYPLRHIAKIIVPDNWRYTPNILRDAQIGNYGFSFSKTPKKGSLCLMDFKAGGDPVMHVGFCVEGLRNYEGNTSPGSEGSQDEGGCVADRTRTRSEIVGYAHPPYGA